MEKLKGKILTVPADIGWSDLGGWLAFEGLWPKDRSKNVVKGETVLVESRGNIVKSEKRLVALLGVENFVVIDTQDALLVCPKGKTEEVRKIVDQLKISNLKKYL